MSCPCFWSDILSLFQDAQISQKCIRKNLLHLNPQCTLKLWMKDISHKYRFVFPGECFFSRDIFFCTRNSSLTQFIDFPHFTSLPKSAHFLKKPQHLASVRTNRDPATQTRALNIAQVRIFFGGGVIWIYYWVVGYSSRTPGQQGSTSRQRLDSSMPHAAAIFQTRTSRKPVCARCVVFAPSFFSPSMVLDSGLAFRLEPIDSRSPSSPSWIWLIALWRHVVSCVCVFLFNQQARGQWAVQFVSSRFLPA